MKKILPLVIVVLITTTIAHAQIGWINHKADDRISVKFPNDPKEIIAGTFGAQDKDNVAYIFTIADLTTVANIDSATLNSLQDSPGFSAKVKKGSIENMPDMHVDDFTISKWKGHTSYTVTGVNTEKKFTLYIFMVRIGSKMYRLSSVIPDGAPTKGRDDFFASLLLNK